MPTETNRTLLERYLVTCISLVIYPPADPQWGHLRGIVCPKQSEDEEPQVLLDENSAITSELRDALDPRKLKMGSRAIVEICHDEASQHLFFCVADGKKEMSSLPGFNLNVGRD
ncbi:hypothetical protein M514_08717 [Trichuris suis]|uniref:Uncharacterized protein n=1 Tax=Trichuris suis TaxID=68888 RepID=A0A085LZU4_9BILA|nr:hypothetical protein M513_08717 [Trichuris suis]KFD62378.1 hypothetical protein M514_08717 [Trichuris suis]